MHSPGTNELGWHETDALYTTGREVHKKLLDHIPTFTHHSSIPTSQPALTRDVEDILLYSHLFMNVGFPQKGQPNLA